MLGVRECAFVQVESPVRGGMRCGCRKCVFVRFFEIFEGLQGIVGGLMRVVRDEGAFDVEKVFFGDFLKFFKEL
jgi:hypothetical protein